MHSKAIFWRFFAIFMTIMCGITIRSSFADNTLSDVSTQNIQQTNDLPTETSEAVEMSTEEADVAASVGNTDEQQEIPALESLLQQLGWEDSNQERRRTIYEKIANLKNELKQNRIDEATDKYHHAKENEQSLENRTLTSATMAATGIGGMELARGLTEQKVDKAAEDQMTSYISTFQCKVGDKRYSGGESQIEIAGGNELINLYQEYVNLAKDLKERKTALGLAAGIESEVVLDKANMGLYDETGKGIENGTYASLYRASQGNQNDTQKINDAKSASEKRVIAGAVIGAAGATAGIIGNLAINGNKNYDNSAFITKRKQIQAELADAIQDELNECNAQIQEKKEWAQEQKNTPEYKKYAGLREFVAEIEKLDFLKTEQDLYKLIGHPVCD